MESAATTEGRRENFVKQYRELNSQRSIRQISKRSLIEIDDQQANIISSVLEGNQQLANIRRRNLSENSGYKWICKVAYTKERSRFIYNHLLVISLVNEEGQGNHGLNLDLESDNACSNDEQELVDQCCDKIALQLEKIFLRLEIPRDREGATKSFREVYRVDEKLQTGGYGVVLRCTHRKQKTSVAAKYISRKRLKEKNTDEAQIYKEVVIMHMLQDHNYIISLHDFFEEENGFYIVMDLRQGGDLFKRIIEINKHNNNHKYSEIDVREICRKVLEGVNYCHERCVAHLDLKPNNLLLRSRDKNDSHIEIADFGLASFVTGPKSLFRRVGTLSFCAPEIIKAEPYDEKADMWSVGVIFFILLSGKYPFVGNDLRKGIEKGLYTFSENWGHISSEAKDLINNLLQVDPDQRYSSKQALSCRWFQMDDVAKLSDCDLSSTLADLDNFDKEMARLKLKVAVNAIIFQQRLQQNMEEKKVPSKQDPERNMESHCKCCIQ